MFVPLDEKKPQEQRTSRIMTGREKLILSLGDLMTITVILVDLLYLSGLIGLSGGDMLALNVIAVAVSFVVYQMKKRIRKRAAREAAAK